MATGIHGPKIGAGMVKMAKTLERAAKSTVQSSALAAKAVHLAAVRRDSGGDGILSGVNRAKGRRGGAKVGVSFKMEGTGQSPQAFLKATGPLQLINNDTAGHVIRSAWATGRGRKGFIGPTIGGQFTTAKGRGFIGPVVSNRRAVLRMPDGNFRRSARHPGTKGKKTWQVSRKAAEPVIRKSMSKRTHNVVKGAARL